MPRKKADSKPIARLIWVLEGEVRVDAPGPNSTAAQALVEELTALGALGATDIASVTAVISLALAVDAMPSDARLWAQYRQAVDALRALDDATEEDDDWASRMGAATVRDAPKPRASKPRVSGRGGKQPARKAADAVPAARVGRRARGGS